MERESLGTRGPEAAGALPGEPQAGSSTWLTGRREWVAVGALVLLAFALRVAYVLGMRSSPAFDVPTMDVAYHVEWASAFARGEDFQPGPFFRAPLYVWFLGAVFRLLGEDLLVARLVQAGLGAASTLLVYLLGRATFDRRVAWWAAVGAATYWVSIYFDGELLIPTLAIPLNLLALCLTVRHARRRDGVSALWAGVVWGLSAIARPNVLLFMPFLAFWIARLARPAWRKGLGHAALLTVGVLMPILPLTTYNALVGGDRALISTQAGVNLWIGNNPSADGSAAIAPGTRATWWGGYRDTIAQAEAAEGRRLAPSEVSSHYTRRAAAFVFAEPEQSVPLLLRKLRLFWLDWELGNNQEIRFFALRFNPWLRFTPLTFALLAAAGLMGIALSWSRRSSTFPLWGFVLVYMLSVVAFFVNGRYRLPVVPVLMIYASHAMLRLVDALRARRLAPAALGLGVVALGVLASRRVPTGLNTGPANGMWQLGVAEEGRGDLAAAEQLQRDALAANPRHPFARVALARILARKGRAAEAIVELDLAVRGPAGVNALEPLLDLYIDSGRIEDALACASAALERYPDLAVLHYNIGRAHFLRKDWRAAQRAFESSEQRDARDPRYPFGAWMALHRLDDGSGARLALERAVDAVIAGGPGSPEHAELIFETYIRLLRDRGEPRRADEIERARDIWRASRSGSPGAGG